MATYITDEGICLRVTDFSETSQIVAMFTRRHGMVPLIAKGAKRASKKSVMSGPLDLLTSGQVIFVPAREGAAAAGGGAQLGILAAWDLADHRGSLRSQLGALNAAMLCAEITTHLVHPLDPHEELFVELQAALALLGEGADPVRRARTAVSYVKAALVAAGYWPRVSACVACGKPVADRPMRFSPRAGGILCGGEGACRPEHGGTMIGVSGRIVLALDRLRLPSQLGSSAPERAADEAALATAMQLLLAQVEAVTDKPVRTRALLQTIFVASRAAEV